MSDIASMHHLQSPHFRDSIMSRFAGWHSSYLAWWILAASILITIAAYYSSANSVDATALARFQAAAGDTRTAIEERMREQEVALRGGVGLFAASEKVSRKEWRDYVASLDLDTFLPGLQGFGYSEMIKPDNLSGYIARVRADGYPNFTVRPEGQRDIYTSITFLEPFDERNSRAFGFDMYSERTRREAMKRAADTGKAAVSGVVTLVQENGEDVQNGFLMYLPVYQKGLPVTNVEERRRAIKGFVYSPFRMRDLMQGILTNGNKTIDFQVEDTTSGWKQKTLLESFSHSRGLTDRNHASFKSHSEIEMGGRVWNVSFWTLPEFDQANSGNQPKIIAGGGLIIDILLFMTITILSNQRAVAESLAETMTSELRQAKNVAEQSAYTETRLRQKAENSNLKLMEANDALQQFTSIVAHDLRSPLKRTRSFINVLREDYAKSFDEEGMDIMNRIERGSNRMGVMLDALLDYSSLDRQYIQGKTAKLTSVISGVLETLDSDRANANISIDVSPEISVVGDPILLGHVMQNLIGNAIKFRNQSVANIQVSARSVVAGDVELSVSDDGIGIEPKYAKTIFQMFSRLHNEDVYEGTGIGLTVCKKIIEDHRGTIQLDVERKKGTRIVITLPRASASTA